MKVFESFFDSLSVLSADIFVVSTGATIFPVACGCLISVYIILFTLFLILIRTYNVYINISASVVCVSHVISSMLPSLLTCHSQNAYCKCVHIYYYIVIDCCAYSMRRRPCAQCSNNKLTS